MIYKEYIADGTAVLRPGIQRLIDEASVIPVSWWTGDRCLRIGQKVSVRNRAR